MTEADKDAEIRRLRMRVLELESLNSRMARELVERRSMVAQLRQLNDQAMDSVFLHDAEGTIVEANRRATQELGYRYPELLGMRLRQLEETLRERDPDELAREWTRMELGVPTTWRGRAVRRDRTTFPVELRIGAFAVGERRMFVTVMRDTSDRETFDQALRESVKRFRFIFEGAPVGMVTTTSSGAILQANRAFQKMLGHDLDELRRLTLPALVHEGDQGRLGAEIAALMSGGRGHIQREALLRSKRGDAVWAQVAMFAEAGEDGALRQVIGVAEDITERKRAETELAQLLGNLEAQVAARTRELGEAKEVAEAANRAKSQFLANMSHELRTPLIAIIGYAEMLAEDAQDEGLAAFVPDLERIGRAGKHLLGLINDILDLSKIEAGKMDLYWEMVDVRGLVDEVTATIRPIAEKNENELVLRLGEDTGALRADVTKLRQILFNLLSNACKFTERGVVSLEVAREVRGGTEHVRFAVRDTGVGMSEQAAEKLFQPFTQADASTTRKYGGTGLGLSISKRFAEMMGGTISVKSSPGRGSTFVVHLPITEEDGTLRPAPRARPELPPREGAAADPERPATVLVVEDDAETRAMVRRMLEKAGHEVMEAAHGGEGLELARQKRPDLLVLDLLMPEMNGFAMLARLELDPRLRGIPVVILTSKDLSAEERSLLATHCLRVLKKGVHGRDELLRLVRAVLRGGGSGAHRRSVENSQP